FISAENVNHVLRRYSVKQDIALLSIDIDGNDFYVWSALGYLRSILVMVEINGSLGADDKVIPYDSEFVSDGTTYYGASLPAMVALARLKGYVLIWANRINALFVKEAYEHRFAHAGDVNFWIRFDDGHPVDPHGRQFVSSEEALRMWHAPQESAKQQPTKLVPSEGKSAVEHEVAAAEVVDEGVETQNCSQKDDEQVQP
ncbi:hypothetical protein FOZ63_017099, partial [Perkinsus olseni]